MPTTRHYRASVPVTLHLEVLSSTGPEETLAAITAAFQRGDDPLLGANVKVQEKFRVASRLDLVVNGGRYAQRSRRAP